MANVHALAVCLKNDGQFETQMQHYLAALFVSSRKKKALIKIIIIIIVTKGDNDAFDGTKVQRKLLPNLNRALNIEICATNLFNMDSI